MQILFSLIAAASGIGCIVCWVITLIKMFKHEETLPAVLGILCGLWAFIWGWMNASKHDHKKIMMIWTGLLILGIIFNIVSGSLAIASAGL